MEYPIRRELDGIYFRVERDGKWENICFSDLTDNEQLNVLYKKDNDWLKTMCLRLSDVIRQIGDQYDLAVMWGDYDD